MANKVKFNICNVHYALFDKVEEGVIKYKTPVPMPGAVSISLAQFQFRQWPEFPDSALPARTLAI